jgi:hypothetical protein
VERKYWQNDDSQQGFRNLTVLDSEGQFKWSFVMNGTLDLWATYPDGTVIIYHNSRTFDQTTQKWVTRADEIVAVSGNGSELWRMDRPLSNRSYSHTRVASNGTLMYTASGYNQTFQVGISKDGSQVFIEERYIYFPSDYGSLSPNGTVVYTGLKEYIDNETSVTSIRAFNVSDGALLWRTILEYGDNPNHNSPGGGQVVFPRVDGQGAIFCNDGEWDLTYCLDPNGTLLWKKPCVGGLWVNYPSGGFLTYLAPTMMRISSGGSVLWQYQVGSLTDGAVLKDSNGTIYYSTGSAIHTLAYSPDNNQAMIVGVFIAIDAIVLVAFVGGYLQYRKEQREKNE